jgi:scyllo-inositol 2-dehydrogenase (NADP+)
MGTKEINVGLVGFGMAGQIFHAPIIRSVPGLRLAKVVERHGSRSKEAYPDTETVRDPSELFRDPGIDLVVIATPNTSHYSLARESILAGKHTVVDKPFTVTTGESDELISLAKEKGVLLSVFQNRRFDGDFRAVERLVREKRLGRIVSCEIRYERCRPGLKQNAWREDDLPGSGILYDLGAHLIDQAFCLFGVPSAVTAFVDRQRDSARADDGFLIILEYGKGPRVLLSAGMLVRIKGPRFALHGTGGSFVKHGMDVQEEDLKKGLTPLTLSPWGREPEGQWGILATDPDGTAPGERIPSADGNYPAFYGNIFAAVTRGEPLAVKPEQARDVIKTIELAVKSNGQRTTEAF